MKQKFVQLLFVLAVIGLVAGFGVNSAVAAEKDGRININTATVEELSQLSGIGGAYAERIVVYREAHGGFKNLNELKNVKGIGPKILARNMDKITIKPVDE